MRRGSSFTIYLTILLNLNLPLKVIAQPVLEKAPKIIVVITPHPDDAEASCGGLIANYIAAGDDVIILNMTGGEYGIWNKSPEEARNIRMLEAKNAGNILGAKEIFFGGIDARGVAELQFIESCERSNMSELAQWSVDADKVFTF